MTRRKLQRVRVCEPCDMEEHNRCRDASCGCCGDFDEPDPYAAMEADPEQYDAEEDSRLAAQFGAWPDPELELLPPEASRR